MLTRKQHELLFFLDGQLKKEGVPPSFDEMREAVGLKSKSGIHRLILALEERGFIRRLPNRARALEVLRLPENLAPQKARVLKGEAAKKATAKQVINSEQDFISLPLYGRIAAGTPIEALNDVSHSIIVPSTMIGVGGEYYALEVAGDSMVEAGIHDGDTVILRRTETADNGAIVVALIDGEEATLKRLVRKGKNIALEPANAAYETRIYTPNRIKVQGRLMGLLRRY